MAEAIARQAEQEGAYPIIHGVFGGKTGLRDTCMPPSRDGGKSSMGVIDACQGRFSLAELHEWLAQGSIVLFTASKFYQAPPFCGAVFVPSRLRINYVSCRLLLRWRCLAIMDSAGSYPTRSFQSA
jgi:hypothetical protein